MPNIEHTISVDLTEKEIQTLTAAMAGNFPESLNQYRWRLLQKLARASHGKPSGAVEALDTLFFELREGNRDSALYAFRELHGDWIERLEHRRAGGR